MLTLRIAAGMFSVSLMVLGVRVASGQDYPNRPIRVVTAAVGGGVDFVARIVAQGISGPLGQPVLVDNRGGGVLPGEIVSKAPADGYTLLVHGGSFWTGSLLEKAPYDPVTDFLPITLTTSSPSVLVVHPSLPVKSVKELIALAKARKGELNCSSGLTGTASHVAAELFKAMAGVNIVRVPYKSGTAEVTDLMSGQIQLTFSNFATVAPLVKTGRLRALAVTTVEPSALLPGLPTVAATLPGFESASRTGVFAPAKTPATVVNRLNQEIIRFLRTADAKEKFLKAGLEAVGSSPEQFAVTMKSEIARLSKVIKDAGIKAD